MKEMKTETILKREDGSRVKIEVSLSIDTWRKEFYWRSAIQTSASGKRKWENTKGYPDVVSKEEVLQASLKLWESIKPSL